MCVSEEKMASLVICGDAIFTGLEDEPVEGAVIVKGNKILTVTDKERAREFTGEKTKIYDYKDKLIMPGFHDSHVHMLLSGLLEDSVNLSTAVSEEEAVEMTRRFADSRPEEPWIIGFGWYHLFWKKKNLPNRQSLDRLFPGQPVVLFNYEVHGAWVNSKALELCQIDRNTPDPSNGQIVRDNSGEPTGYLYETAMGLVTPLALDIPKERQLRLIRKFLHKAACYGITSIGDIQNFIGHQLGDPEIYRLLEGSGELTTRIHFVTGLTGNLETARIYRDKYNSGRTMFSGLKQLIDGVPTAYTGLLLEPYSDKPETSGSPFSSLELLREWILEADKENFRIRLHACGDGAVRFALDYYEYAQRINGIRDSRHCIEHIEIIHPGDIKRFSNLGVIASMQPEHMAITEKFEDNPYRVRLGEKREKYTWAIRSLMRADAAIQFGSDYPVVDMNPMLEIYRAVTRVHNDGKPRMGWNSDERLTISEALKNYTIGPAYGAFRENELGTLESGKLADIIVLDKNLFRVPIEEIRSTGVVLNIMDGQIVYENKYC